MMTRAGMQSDNLRMAVIVILLTVMTLSLGDAVIKALSANLVLWQIFVLRSCLAVPLLLLVLKRRFSSVALVPKAPGWTAVRSLMLVAMWVFYYASLPHLQLSVAAAAYYTLPLFITLFSAFLIGETVGRAGWFAVVLGFAGVVLILKPATDDFNFYAVLPLISAMLYALAMILTRTKCRDEHPLVLSGALNITFIAVGVLATFSGSFLKSLGISSPFLSSTWATMGNPEILAVMLLGVAILVASIGTAVAYQNGPSSVVATFDFAYVGFAVIWGLLFFQEWPDTLAVAGIMVITVAGVIAVRRQSPQKRHVDITRSYRKPHS
ncbi:MAG: DMT family transporter [Anderseniella sp.]